MSNLESNYRLYRVYFKLPALVAYLAAKNALNGSKAPISYAKLILERDCRMWIVSYVSRSSGECSALRVMRDR